MTSYGRTLFRLLWIAGSSCAVCFFALAVPARTQEAPIIPNSIVVVFQGQTLPADAAAHVQRAGGAVTSTMANVCVLVARPANVDSATLIQNLGKDSAIFGADYDRMLSLIAPEQVASEIGPISQTDIAHPCPTFQVLPFPTCCRRTSSTPAALKCGQ